MAGTKRKRTPEEIRLIPAKGTGQTGRRQQRQTTPKKTKRPGAGAKQNDRSMSNISLRTQGASGSARPEFRVASTTKKSVMFTLEAPAGLEVSVAGSFNDWKPQAMTKGSDGLWRITVQLAHGTYEYKFLVDGDWREDPNNPRRTQNELGGYNSICNVL